MNNAKVQALAQKKQTEGQTKAKALQDNRSFRVEIEGHASSEGGDEHNQDQLLQHGCTLAACPSGAIGPEGGGGTLDLARRPPTLPPTRTAHGRRAGGADFASPGPAR